MTFADIPAIQKGIFLTIFTVFLLLSMVSMIMVVSTKAKSGEFFYSVILLVLGTAFLYLGSEVTEWQSDGAAYWFGKVPVMMLFFLGLVYGVASSVNLVRLIRWNNSHVTLHSIKESLDLIPTGLCYFINGGMPVLVNRKMTELCDSITGQEMFNGEDFWNTLEQKADQKTIVELEDGSFYSFTRKQLPVLGTEIYELIASDVTAQYVLSQELNSENQRLIHRNQRLLRFNQKVEEVTREKEILSAKIRIHDNIGHLLLFAKRVIHMNVDEKEKEKLLRLWQQDNTLFIGSHPAFESDSSFVDLESAAASLGIKLRYQGNLPHDHETAVQLTVSLIRECMTNAFSHAKASEMKICFSETDRYYLVDCTNDGRTPTGNIVEGGGLSLLRKQVEEAGGTLEIISVPVFKLSAVLPKGEDTYGEKI